MWGWGYSFSMLLVLRVTNEKSPFSGPPKIYDFWGEFWEI